MKTRIMPKWSPPPKATVRKQVSPTALDWLAFAAVFAEWAWICGHKIGPVQKFVEFHAAQRNMTTKALLRRLANKAVRDGLVGRRSENGCQRRVFAVPSFDT